MLYEVSKHLLQARGESAAFEALFVMQKGVVVQLSPSDLLAAAKTAVKHQLSLADAIIWQTAEVHGATLYTQDAGLSRKPNVSCKAKN